MVEGIRRHCTLFDSICQDGRDVRSMFFPRDGDRAEFWRVRLLAGCFFHHHGAMLSVWANEPTSEWMLDNYSIKNKKMEKRRL